MWMIRRATSGALSVLFPERCTGCGKRGDLLCHSCGLRLRKALSIPHPYIISLFDFKDPVVKRAIHAIKYHHRRDLVKPLTSALANEMRGIIRVKDYTLVPIPMPRLRKLLRGYNQAELIAEQLGKELSLSVDTNILWRTASPTRQVKTTSRAARIENQKGTFRAAREVAGMRIILVDDVTTTGSTIEAARRELMSKRAANVLAVTLAH